jgi:hypothetical protein
MSAKSPTLHPAPRRTDDNAMHANSDPLITTTIRYYTKTKNTVHKDP